MTRRARPAEAARAGTPDRGTLAVRLWLRLLTSATLISDRLRRNLRDEFGVTLPAFDLLAQAAREPRGPTMSELSRRLMVTKGNVSELVERLEKDGLLERHADQDDGRVQHVHLTAAGEALIERMLPAHGAWLAELTSGVDETTLTDLHVLLGTLKDGLSRSAARTAPSSRGGAGPSRTTAPGGGRRRRRRPPADRRALRPGGAR